eukprot:5422014-Pyramimonas_sp.AAC.1
MAPQRCMSAATTRRSCGCPTRWASSASRAWRASSSSSGARCRSKWPSRGMRSALATAGWT